MMYIGCVSSFLKFGGQTFKNVHDVLKVCFEMTSCVLESFVEFYAFVLDEIYMECLKLIYENIWIGNVQVKVPKDHPRVLEEGPKFCSQTAQATHGNRRPVCQLTPRLFNRLTHRLVG